ncbi:MAG: hypothetical protein FWE72_06930 [Spirochaetaceae bacterium]|nr:hypothetical protein [Spirochaetaceae bacterium]
MPAIKDIDKLKDKLNSLGNEPAIMAKAGKKIHDVTPETQGVPDDISALLDNLSEDAPSRNSIPDFNTLLNADTPDLDSFSLPQDMESENLEKTDAFDIDLPENPSDLDLEDLSAVEEGEEEDLGLAGLDLEDAEASVAEEGKEEDFDLSSLDLEDAEASAVEEGEEEDLGLSGLDLEDLAAGEEGKEEDFDLSSLDLEDAEASAAGEEGKEEDFDLSSLDPDSAGANEKEELDDLENIFGDDSLELNDDPNALLDDLSEQEDISDSSDALDLSSLDDIFKDKEQNGETPLEAIEEESFDSAPEDEQEEVFPLPDDLNIPESDLGIESLEDNLDVDLPDLDLDLDGTKEEDFALPDDLGDLDLPAEEDLGDLTSAAETDMVSDIGEEEDLELAELGEEELPAEEDLGDLASVAETDMGSETGEEESLELSELGTEDENFDIGSLDTISMDDEFEKKEDEESIIESDEQQEDTGLSSDYNLQDFGDKFGSVDDLEDTNADDLSKNAATQTTKGIEISDTADGKEERSEDSYISSINLRRVTETLSLYPGNLKLYIEDLIGNRDIPKAHLDNLVDKLAAGFSAREVADYIFRITGKRIRIPAQYQRKTYQELEREKGTLAYIIKHKVAPFVGKALAASFVILFALFLINNFIRKPIHSSWLYKKGYQALINDNFTESEKNFLKASRILPAKKQFYRYADAFIEKREYALAEAKYLQLLGISLSSEREKPARDRQRGFFPGDKKGFIDYSVLKTYYQGEYSRAERIIDDFLYIKGNKWDYDMLIKKIDNNFNWAEIDNAKYEAAEFIINDSISKFGTKPDLYLRKITHAVRSGKLLNMRNEALESIDDSSTGRISGEKRKYYGILGQYRGYIENLKGKFTDPYIATDFYGYHITNEKNIDGIDKELVKLSNIDKKLLEPHSQLARFWNLLERPEMERRSLQYVEKLSEESSLDHMRKYYPHSYMYSIKHRKDFEITAFNRLGNFEHEDQNILSAQKYYQRAIAEYERNKDILGVNPKYAKLYEDNGDLFYYSAGKYNDALREFLKAEATGYRENNLSYKIGFINYKNKNYKEAADRFYEISVNKRDSESVLFAFANSSFYNNVYSPALAYYEYVIEKLEYWKDKQVVFELERRKDQQSILQRLTEAYNNLGATLYKLSEKSQNSSYYSSALVNLTKSAELYDFMSRDPVTVNRSFTKPLAQLNLQYVLLNSGRPVSRTANNVIPYSAENIKMDGPIIYAEIDKDMFGRVDMILESQ